MNTKILSIGFLVLAIVILVFISFSLFIKQEIVSTPSNLEILSTKNGEPMLSNGNCNTSVDCFMTGCSRHICANHEIVTSCETVEFPNKENYTCGCIENLCVWFTKY